MKRLLLILLSIPAFGAEMALNDGSNITSAATWRTNLSLVLGTHVQAYDDNLLAIANISPAQGDLMIFNGANWARLAPGTSGEYLKTQGAGANPVWDTPAGSGDVTAASSFGTDNVLVRSDGVGKGVQATGISVDDSDNISGVGDLSSASLTVGAIALGDGAGIEAEGVADAMADDTYQGFKVIGGRNAGETITQWDLVYLNPADGEWHQADADESTAAGKAWGVATTAGTDGNPIDVLVSGIVRNDGWAWSAAGVDLFVSDVAGAMTETAPSTTGDVVKLVARTISDDEVYIDVGHDYLEAP